mmetsp:Transcript_22676/g.59153  ORF Transcript_22676/g.59153 Transcript_22676/m.59153 type:complete len:105 (+) Transcript_22676:481-795(+)
MLFGELVLADGLLLLMSRTKWMNISCDLAEAWQNGDKYAYRCFFFICAVAPFVACYNVISELCITSVWEGGAVDPNWVLSQCPPLPGSYEDIRSWKNTTGVSGF